MALQFARFGSGGSAAWLGALLLACGLAGCNGPVEAIRSVTGFNKNDPDPATTPFTANLDKAEGGTYPNLASVPPPPAVASTLAERQKLANSLTGTRTAAEVNGGSPSAGPVPPPPAIPPSLQAPEIAALQQPVPPSQTPPPVMRPVDEPPSPLPPTSAVVSPTIANPPLIEAFHPAPAPGQPSAMPQPGSSALTTASLQTGNPQPSPPAAVLPPVPPPPETVGRPPPKLPPVPITVASLDVPLGAAALAPAARPQLNEAVKQYQQKPRTVRVVAYAASAVGGAEQLNSFRAALDRAQIVAQELAAAGVPANRIQTEAAPSSASDPVGRVEIQLLP